MIRAADAVLAETSESALGSLVQDSNNSIVYLYFSKPELQVEVAKRLGELVYENSEWRAEHSERRRTAARAVASDGTLSCRAICTRGGVRNASRVVRVWVALRSPQAGDRPGAVQAVESLVRRGR